VYIYLNTNLFVFVHVQLYFCRPNPPARLLTGAPRNFMPDCRVASACVCKCAYISIHIYYYYFWINICKCIYILYIHIYINIYVCIYIHTYIYICTSIQIYVYIYVHMSVHLHTCNWVDPIQWHHAATHCNTLQQVGWQLPHEIWCPIEAGSLCVFVNMYIHIYVNIDIYIGIYVYIYWYEYISVCMWVYIRTDTKMCFVYIYVYLCTPNPLVRSLIDAPPPKNGEISLETPRTPLFTDQIS